MNRQIFQLLHYKILFPDRSATVAAVIGGGGLGDFIFIGLKLQKPEMLISGALTVSLLAIVVDAIMAMIEKKVISKGLQIKKI